MAHPPTPQRVNEHNNSNRTIQASVTSFGPVAAIVAVTAASNIAIAGTGVQCSTIERGIIIGGYILALIYVICHAIRRPDPFNAFRDVKCLRVWIRLASIVGQLVVGAGLVIMQNGTKCFIAIPQRAQSLLQGIGLGGGALLLIGAWQLLLHIFNKYRRMQHEKEKSSRRTKGSWVATRALELLKRGRDKKVVLKAVEHWMQIVPSDDKLHEMLAECNWKPIEKKFGQQEGQEDKLSTCCKDLLDFQDAIECEEETNIEDIEDPPMLRDVPNPLDEITPIGPQSRTQSPASSSS